MNGRGVILASMSDEKGTYAATNANNKEQHNGLTLIDLFHVLFKHTITAIIGFVAVFGCACMYLLVTTPEYSATAQTFTTYSDSSSTDATYSSLGSAASYISTQVQSYPNLIKTDVVLQPVINQLHLNESVGDLAQHVTATNPTNTAFINIAVTSTNPQQASQIANAVATSFQNVVQSSLYADGKPSPVKITIVQEASVPASPTSPKTSLVLVAGIVGGLVVGIIAALLKDLFSRKIQDESELEYYINAPVLGRIPEDEEIGKDASVIVSQPGSVAAEDYRRICTNLTFIAPVSGTNSRLIVVSAVGANEGKTTTSVNLAAALAENGATVLLIDADLRHPSVANKLNIDGSAGLAHVLSGQASVKDVVQRYWKSNLHIMPAGPKPPNASQLINSPIMSELIEHALHQYDYVIIDTPPLVVANDAAIFAKQGGGLVIVSRRAMTRKKELTDTANELRNLHVDVTGFVFNGAKDEKTSLYGSNYYYYSNDSKGTGEHHHHTRKSSTSRSLKK